MHIAIGFHRYFSPSINDNERERTDGHQDHAYVISGPHQTTPADFNTGLRNNCFKETIVRFFTEHWSTDERKSFAKKGVGKSGQLLLLHFLKQKCSTSDK